MVQHHHLSLISSTWLSLNIVYPQTNYAHMYILNFDAWSTHDTAKTRTTFSRLYRVAFFLFQLFYSAYLKPLSLKLSSPTYLPLMVCSSLLFLVLALPISLILDLFSVTHQEENLLLLGCLFYYKWMKTSHLTNLWWSPCLLSLESTHSTIISKMHSKIRIGYVWHTTLLSTKYIYIYNQRNLREV